MNLQPCITRRLSGHRGLSSVIGTIFFVIIVMAAFAGLIVYTIQRQTYMTINVDLPALNERINIYNASTLSTDFNITVDNEGNEMVRLITVYFWNETIHVRFEVNTTYYSGYLYPKEDVTLNSAHILNQTDYDWATFDWCKVVTERGNMAIAPTNYTVSW